MNSSPSNRFLLRQAAALTTVALSLTAIGQANAQALTSAQSTTISNLSSASVAIKDRVSLGLRYSGAFATSANEGVIVDPTAHQRAVVTEAQRLAYNASLSTFKSTDFYNADQFFRQKSDEAKIGLRSAISDLSASAVELQKVASLNQQLQGATDAISAKAIQSTITSSGLGTEISSQQIGAYNTSLANVNSYASQAAAFMRAAGSKEITQNLDSFKAQYGLNLAYAGASFDYATGAVGVSWDKFSMSQSGALDSFKMSGDDFYKSVTDPFGGK
jgi:hypothetical protein